MSFLGLIELSVHVRVIHHSPVTITHFTAMSATAIFIFLILSSASSSSAAAAVSPTPVSSSTIDPKQLRALQSLNIPTAKDPCAPPPRQASSPTATCDASKPFRHLLSLTVANCTDDVALSSTALKSLSTLTSLTFTNCPISLIRFPAELSSNLHSFTSIRSLKKLTGVWLSRMKNLTELTVSETNITASGAWIILSGKKYLHSVTLSQTNLSSYLPKYWHQNLTSINLSGNHLKGKIPLSLTRLENLAHLDLSSNSLNEAIPSTIGDLSSLQNLSLGSNSLSGPIPESLAALPELMHLDLSANQLNGTIPNFVRDMKKLKYLNLESNNFHGVLPFNATFVKGSEVFKVGGNTNLCYNHSSFPKKVKLGIGPCDKHGLPMLPPPAAAKDSSSGDSSDNFDYEDYNNVEKSHHHKGPSKFVLGVAIGLSSIVFLIVFLILLAKCCK